MYIKERKKEVKSAATFSKFPDWGILKWALLAKFTIWEEMGKENECKNPVKSASAGMMTWEVSPFKNKNARS